MAGGAEQLDDGTTVQNLAVWQPVAPRDMGFCLGMFVMSVVTLSFLVTTPECWVPDRGGPEHGFPLLCGAGRLVVKDAIMAGAALVTMADSAKAYLRRRAGRTPAAGRSSDTIAA